MRSICCFITFLMLSGAWLYGQAPEKPSAVDIYHDIQKLNTLGNALYVAAHPDDENTRLIAYMSNELKARTAYLSLTRGDGGQNRIGEEIREELGVIRTQELLGARAIDGGEQFFSRANDFGYSKNPEETLDIWDKSAVLYDMVKVIRAFKPDIIVNRFDHRNQRRTHGHHTSSAMLSFEAFDLAQDPNYKTGQEPWTPKRMFFNTSWWFYGSREKFDKADKSQMMSVDIGTYYPAVGKSNSEIAALSRSMHKSQGFGAVGTRGSRLEYLELIKGDTLQDRRNLFDGVNTTWTRVPGGAPIGEALDAILADYNFTNPAQHIDQLIAVRKEIAQLSDEYWREQKLKEIDEIIIASAGLYLEAVAEDPHAVPGETISVAIEATNRSSYPIELSRVSLGDKIKQNVVKTLDNNQQEQLELSYPIDVQAPYSNPYWLNMPASLGMYTVVDTTMLGVPENPPAITSTFDLVINDDQFLSIERPVVYKMRHPVKGEVYKPFAFLPRVSVELENPVYVFANREYKEVRVKLTSFADSLSGQLKLMAGQNWIIRQDLRQIDIAGKGVEKEFVFEVKGPLLSESSELKAVFIDSEGRFYQDGVSVIEYDHIPTQYVIKPAKARAERIKLSKSGNRIAYVEGAGDEVPECLRQIDYEVDILTPEEITASRLSGYDALVFGVRAFNVAPELKLRKPEYMEYMQNGGTVIVQYNTNRGGLHGDDIAPYPMTISRDRVTDESARFSFVGGLHPVLKMPNVILQRDFDGWVQERGLYFPNEWDERYQTPFLVGDPNEPQSKGSLLIAPVGKGHFIYTGISWFRQLPAGVPGAYRLFANLISIGQQSVPDAPTNESGSN